jgi:N-acetyl-alpha-D-glucosaminyl L-malate synthase BshA
LSGSAGIVFSKPKQKQMMRIGITCYPTYGGSGVVATELGLELAQRGHQVHFISYSQPIRLTEPQPNIHYHEVEVSRYPLFEYPPYDLALATRMAEVAEIYELDLLHVHYAIPHSVSAMLARQMLCCDHARKSRRLPYVTTLHGTDITLVGADPSYLPITRFSIDQSDGVTSISNYLKQHTLEVFDVKTPIEVIPNFVNCDLYERTDEVRQRRSEYASADEKILVHLSNFRPVKRIPDVIEIFERVQQKVPARLLMIGDGPERSRAEWLAVNRGLHNKIDFLGKQDRIHEKLGVADMMLMPSQLESFGLAALEAMACEVVPIATNVGGVPEVIDHGKTGFLADVGDVQTMANHAIEVLSDEKKLKQMGEAARAAAQARFCASKIIPMYEKHYRDVLERAS